MIKSGVSATSYTNVQLKKGIDITMVDEDNKCPSITGIYFTESMKEQKGKYPSGITSLLEPPDTLIVFGGILDLDSASEGNTPKVYVTQCPELLKPERSIPQTLDGKVARHS